MATETSVVVALKEVRRLEIERQRREEDARMRADDDRGRGDGGASVQYGPGMVPFGQNGHNGWDGNGAGDFARPLRRTSEVMPLEAQGFAAPQSYVGAQLGGQLGQQPPMWEGTGFPSERVKAGSSWKAVVVTLLLVGGAAGAGGYKLYRENKTSQSALSVIQADLRRAEEARNEAVAARSKAEQELKVKVTEMEAKLTTSNAKMSAASAALLAARTASPAAAAPAAAAPAPLARAFRRGRGFGRGAFGGKPALAKPVMPAPMPKAAPAPLLPPPAVSKIAKKKALSDDPLGGLKL